MEGKIKMTKRLSNQEREEMGSDYKPKDKRKSDRRVGLTIYCSPKMERRSKNRRSDNRGK